MIKVYGVSLSPFVRKVLLALELKGLGYEQEMVMPGSPPEGYESISPLKKVPAIDHDGFTVADSSIIGAYLDEVYPDTPLFPAAPQDRARARFLEEYGDTRLVENAAPFFFQRIVRPNFFKEEPDESALAEISENVMPGILSYLEAQVPASGFLFGDQPGMADLGIASPLLNAHYGGYEIEATRYPGLAGYFGRVRQHPIVAARLEKEQGEMAAMTG